jgi:aspartyl/asparaginyl beta-hydroxylase (cupin superfamily)
MLKKRTRPWLSDNNLPYPSGMPRLYNPADYDFVKYVEANWQIVRDELLSAIKSTRATDEFKPYQDLEKTDKAAAWKTAGLMYWTLVSRTNTALFPKTWEIFKKVPNITSCSLHLLEPHATIKPHIGDTDAMLRCHIGLIVPAQLPRCGFRVDNEMVSWEEGKIFIFNDACEHTAWNNTNKDRYVLSFDVMLPQYVDQKHWIASQVLGKIHVEVMYQHVGWMRRHFDKKWIRSILFVLAKLYWRVRVVLQTNLPQSFSK